MSVFVVLNLGTKSRSHGVVDGVTDRDGGDYEGDEGRIYSLKKLWDTVDCIPIREEEALVLKKYVYNYSKDHDIRSSIKVRDLVWGIIDVLSQLMGTSFSLR